MAVNYIQAATVSSRAKATTDQKSERQYLSNWSGTPSNGWRVQDSLHSKQVILKMFSGEAAMRCRQTYREVDSAALEKVFGNAFACDVSNTVARVPFLVCLRVIQRLVKGHTFSNMKWNIIFTSAYYSWESLHGRYTTDRP